jgi:hypothetical protein
MTEEQDSPMEPTEANDRLRITKSSYPSDRESVDAEPAEGCQGDPSPPSEEPEPAENQPGGDSYTRSD